MGVQGVIDSVYVLGGSSREVKSNEKEAGAYPTAIALDGIAVVVILIVNYSTNKLIGRMARMGEMKQ